MMKRLSMLAVFLAAAATRGGSPPDPLPAPRFRVFTHHGTFLVAPAMPAQTSTPGDINQVLVKAFDATNNALLLNANVAPGGQHTPGDANQVSVSVFDSTNNALRVRLLPGGSWSPSKLSGFWYVDGAVYPTLASLISAIGPATGGNIHDCVPETWSANPFPQAASANITPQNGTYAHVTLCGGTWTTQVPIVLTSFDQITGASAPNPAAAAASAGTVIQADPNNFPAPVPNPPTAPTLADAGAGASGLLSGSYAGNITWLVNLQTSRTQGITSISRAASGVVTVTLTGNAPRLLGGQSNMYVLIAGTRACTTAPKKTPLTGIYAVTGGLGTNTITYSQGATASDTCSFTGSGTNLQGNASFDWVLQETLAGPTSGTVSLGTTGDKLNVTAPATGAGGNGDNGICILSANCGTQNYHAKGLTVAGFMAYVSDSTGANVFRRNVNACLNADGSASYNPAVTANIGFGGNSTAGCPLGWIAQFNSGGPFASNGTYSPLLNETNFVLVLGGAQAGDSVAPTFRNQVSDLSIDCSGIAGGAVYYNSAQEQSGLKTVGTLASASSGGAYGCQQTQVYWQGPQSQNSFLDGFTMGDGPSGTPNTAFAPYVPVLIDVRNGAGPRFIRDMTITPYKMPATLHNAVGAAGKAANVQQGMLVTGSITGSMVISAIHCEYMITCITTDQNAQPVLENINGVTNATMVGPLIHATAASGPITALGINSYTINEPVIQDDHFGSTTTATFTSISRSANNASPACQTTVTVSNSFKNGGLITVGGVSDSSFNGTFPIYSGAAGSFAYDQPGCTNSSTVTVSASGTATGYYINTNTSATHISGATSGSKQVLVTTDTGRASQFPGGLSAIRMGGANSGATSPTCAFTTGGGTTPNCTLESNSTDTDGVINLVTGTGAPGSTGSVTLTFSTTLGPFGVAGASCIAMPDDAQTAWNVQAVAHQASTGAAPTTMLFNWSNNGVTLATSSTYKLTYHCFTK